MKTQPIVTPLALSETRMCTVTPPWFVQRAEYAPVRGSFHLLVNGQEAFGALHRAIDSAKKSVLIICWGFQPSMHFVRNGRSLTIGQLLEHKAEKGVLVKMLSFAVDPLWLGVNITGIAIDESQVPGRHVAGLKDRPITSTDDQYRYDCEWYCRYDREQVPADHIARRLQGIDTRPRSKNLRFYGRGFSIEERAKSLVKSYAEKSVSLHTRLNFSAGPSHHQKMVLIDHEDPESCVGFVMGHNMLDEYWDTCEHSHQRKAFNQGRNGERPREDLSSRVTGPVCGNLFYNFAQAWKKETGEQLSAPDFTHYPVKNSASPGATPVVAQVLRTQPQYGVEHIKDSYLQAVNNASQYIYIENQYFRWPQLAEKIKACAQGQGEWGRTPETHGPLYLFIVTNAISEGMGAGVVKTQRMLQSLGRADVLPQASRLQGAEDINAKISYNKLKLVDCYQRQPLLTGGRGAAGSKGGKLAEANQNEIKRLEAENKVLQEKKKQLQDETKSVEIENIPGLKVHICTLVAPDSQGIKGTTGGQMSKERKSLTREERRELVEERLAERESELAPYYRERRALDDQARLLQGSGAGASLTQRYTALNQRYANTLKARDDLQEELKGLSDHSSGMDWVDVYVHAKLMLIDDTFMTLGSANINTRSMQVDSELNIAHAHHEVTREARRRLWGMHTNSRSGGEVMGKEGMKAAFNTWHDIIKENKDARHAKRAPIASLIEFYSGTTKLSNGD